SEIRLTLRGALMPAPKTKVATSARPASSRPRIGGPSAWTGADMRGRAAEWTYRLSPSEIAEIETAAKAAQARGLDIADIRREDFPLPTLGPVLERGGRPRIAARHEFHAGRHPVPAQSYNPARALGL